VRAYREGDNERAREAHLRLVPLVQALFCETNPIPVKAALAMMGLIREELRLPLTPLADSLEQLHAATLDFLVVEDLHLEAGVFGGRLAGGFNRRG